MFALAVVFVVAMQSALSQNPLPPTNIPAECTRPPAIQEKPHNCCIIPPFFSDDAFTECGFKKLGEVRSEEVHRGPPDCSKQLCMLKKYHLLKDETTINYDALSQYMDQWAENNPAFKSAVATAKERCVGKPLPGPPQVCEANKLVFCISTTLFTECPAWQETLGCRKLRDHMDLCRPFFKKP